MKNERGLTLFEVLATITISTILLGVVFMLLSSTNLLSRTNSDKLQSDAEIRNTIDRIAREVSDSNAAYLLANELRYVTFVSGKPEVRSLYFNEPSRTLTLYRYLQSDLTTNVSPSSAAAYIKIMDLTTHLKEIKYIDHSSSDPIPAYTSFGYGAGEVSLFRMQFTFEFPSTTLFGGSRLKTISRESGFKLLQY